MPAQEVIGQQEDVAPALAQGRQLEVEHLEPEVQVFAELAPRGPSGAGRDGWRRRSARPPSPCGRSPAAGSRRTGGSAAASPAPRPGSRPPRRGTACRRGPTASRPGRSRLASVKAPATWPKSFRPPHERMPSSNRTDVFLLMSLPGGLGGDDAWAATAGGRGASASARSLRKGTAASGLSTATSLRICRAECQAGRANVDETRADLNQCFTNPGEEPRIQSQSLVRDVRRGNWRASEFPATTNVGRTLASLRIQTVRDSL